MLNKGFILINFIWFWFFFDLIGIFCYDVFDLFVRCEFICKIMDLNFIVIFKFVNLFCVLNIYKV